MICMIQLVLPRGSYMICMIYGRTGALGWICTTQILRNDAGYDLDGILEDLSHL